MERVLLTTKDNYGKSKCVFCKEVPFSVNPGCHNGREYDGDGHIKPQRIAEQDCQRYDNPGRIGHAENLNLGKNLLSKYHHFGGHFQFFMSCLCILFRIAVHFGITYFGLI